MALVFVKLSPFLLTSYTVKLGLKSEKPAVSLLLANDTSVSHKLPTSHRTSPATSSAEVGTQCLLNASSYWERRRSEGVLAETPAKRGLGRGWNEGG